jgi:hypothetical protein
VNPELTSGIVLAVVLLGLAGFFAWRQMRALQALRTQEALSREDRRYHRSQAWRRIAGSVIMALCAGLIIGWFFLEDWLKQSAKLSVLYWSTCLLLVLAIILLAAVDFWAIARYGLRHHRQLQADRQAMLESHAARLRSQRNGHY